jgi:hypothetical protein
MSCNSQILKLKPEEILIFMFIQVIGIKGIHEFQEVEEQNRQIQT